MRSEQHSGSSSRTKLSRDYPSGDGVSLRMLFATVLVGVMVVLFAQGYSLPESLIEGIRNLPIRNPWFLGISAYVGLMVFLGCCLFLIPRDDVEEIEA